MGKIFKILGHTFFGIGIAFSIMNYIDERMVAVCSSFILIALGSILLVVE